METSRGPVGALEGASALIIGTVGSDGTPRAARAWGAEVLDDGRRLRLFLDADDDVTLANLRENGRIAVTGADVPTLRSVQVKGSVEAVESPTALDLALQERCTELFFRDVEATDRTPRALLDRIVPRDFVVGVVTVGELFDQTPGPEAGAPVVDRP